MKKLIISLGLILSSFLTVSAQKVQVDSKGNYVAVKATAEAGKPTGKTYTDSKGNVYPVYVSAKGKLYVIRTSKTGNQYKQYLKL